ncbi:MAG: hypothetical protein EBS76_09080 [Actinobacteria bacterium]|nr:hypothetical protein [Actinomycetota bacterium]
MVKKRSWKLNRPSPKASCGRAPFGLEAGQAAITGGTTLSLTREFVAGLAGLLDERKSNVDDAFSQASECQ